MEIEILCKTVLTNRNAALWSYISQSDVFNDRPSRQASAWLDQNVWRHVFYGFFLEEIVKINFNNYLLLYEIELVHIFFSRLLITNI